MRVEENPLVTIAIPTYNRAGRYLPQALKSALAQDYGNLEILVADNASTDNTEELVRSFDDPRLRYCRHANNIGSHKNCNFCVTEARGAYFQLLHDDDLIDPDFISSCMAAAQGRVDIGVIRSGIRVIGDQGETLRANLNRAGGLSLTEFFQSWFQGHTAIYLANTLYNTRGLQAAGGFSQSLLDDTTAVIQLAAKSGRADVAEVKASFRRHASNAGGDPKLVMAWARDCLELRDIMVDLTPAKDRGLIEPQATKFLCQKAYKQALNLPGDLDRLRAYLKIYSMFNYRHSPLALIVKPWRHRLRNTVHRLARRPPAASP